MLAVASRHVLTFPTSCGTLLGEQVDVPSQRDLLKAATYGIAFAAGFPNTKLYETCQRLRILNNIREPQVGIAMTMNQLDQQSISTLISRLIHRSEIGRAHV